METGNNRPNAALINREWFEAAKTICQPELLGRILYAATEYVLYGEISVDVSGQAGIVLAMIKPALDSDIAKYRERCARNAANARSQRQRVGASGSESQRVGANTTTTPTPTTTTTPTLSREGQSEKEKEVERWLVYGHFWSIGSKAITEELNAFWSYYESLGWKNNKGAQIVSKVAAARMWRNQFELGAAPDGAKAWLNAVRQCPIPDYKIFQCYAGAERVGGQIVVHLRCSDEYLTKLRAAVPTLERDLRAAWRVQDIRLESADHHQ